MTDKQLKDFAGEMMLRVKNNETLVKAYLTEAGIERYGHIRFLDLKQLYEVNNDKFMEMFYILFPEYKPTKACGDGTGGKIATDILTSLFGAAGNTLSNIYGSTGSENIIAYQEQNLRQQQKTTYVILAVVAVIAIAIVAFVIIGRNNSNVQVVK